MKAKLITLLAVLLFCAGANAQNSPANEQPAKKILIAYFSWGGNTQHVAEHIASLTGGTLFRIEPENRIQPNINLVPKWRKRKRSRMPDRLSKQG